MFLRRKDFRESKKPDGQFQRKTDGFFDLIARLHQKKKANSLSRGVFNTPYIGRRPNNSIPSKTSTISIRATIEIQKEESQSIGEGRLTKKWEYRSYWNTVSHGRLCITDLGDWRKSNTREEIVVTARGRNLGKEAEKGESLGEMSGEERLRDGKGSGKPQYGKTLQKKSRESKASTRVRTYFEGVTGGRGRPSFDMGKARTSNERKISWSRRCAGPRGRDKKRTLKGPYGRER